MWSIDDIITTLKGYQEKYNIKGSMDVDKFCMGLDLDINGVVYLLAYMFVVTFKAIRQADDELRKLRAENERLNRLLYDKCGGNGRRIQMAKVMSGMPIARKQKKSLMDLSFQMSLGMTDKQLMEYFEISKTTLWRWKKELEEAKKTNKRLYF